MLCFPEASVEVVNLATPELRVTVPRIVVPSMKITVPVTGPPNFDGFGEEVSLVVVLSRLTTWLSTFEVLATKELFPLYAVNSLRLRLR
jgi:hypothetical protein